MDLFTVSAVLAGCLWGIISVFLKGLTSAGFSSPQIMFLRAFVSSFLLFIVLLIKNKKLLKINLRDLWMFVGTGVISLTFFSLCYFKTILESGASVGVILLYTSPIFVLILSCILFSEKITVPKIFSLIMTFAGCILVSGIGSGQNQMSFKGFIIGICAGFGYALYSIFSRFALKKYNSMTVTFYTFVFSAVSLIPFVHVTHIPELISSNVSSVFLIICISLFCTVLPYIFYTYGLSGMETGKAAIMVTVEPLIGSLTGIFIWKENADPFKIAGILLILLATILLGLQKSDSSKN